MSKRLKWAHHVTIMDNHRNNNGTLILHDLHLIGIIHTVSLMLSEYNATTSTQY